MGEAPGLPAAGAGVLRVVDSAEEFRKLKKNADPQMTRRSKRSVARKPTRNLRRPDGSVKT
jgi:hypothetical protein